MNTQPLSVKSLVIAFLIYVVTTVILAVVLSVFWQSGIDTTAYSQQQLIDMAAQSNLLTIGSMIIGSLMAVICAYFITRRTGSDGYKHAMYFAGLLILYGILGVFLHPEHHVIQQAAKLLAPAPLCLLGARFALANMNKKHDKMSHGACE
ncbi:MAG: hypothetical protein SWN10_13025 [Pseudomonadota bacterium]|uniref:Uncharacterized protein n=1 Tax=Alteromonas alba TaxID=2079529 RepID=A0A2S9VD76_9ALTE|nr:hypothetical protein [Alteromonas alba]MDY6928003.1 hypothetical protein [Pseudomonadota bacterium]PRO74407.1 hypothetical protein C6Y40_06475 [Alteromonas alba]